MGAPLLLPTIPPWQVIRMLTETTSGGQGIPFTSMTPLTPVQLTT